MSTNCVRCGTAPRVAPGLLCSKCGEKDFEENISKALLKYPAMADFCGNFAAHCGAPASVFKGQLWTMMNTCFAQVVNDGGSTNPTIPLVLALCRTFEEDFLLACRYLYYVKAKPVMSDATYDEAEAAYMAGEVGSDCLLMQPGSDCKDDYPDRVQALAFYLVCCVFDKETPKA